MKPWDTFLPLVLPHCPGCPDLVAEDEIRNAAEEFLAKSFTWRYTTPAMVTALGQADYTPILPAGARMVKLHEGTIDTEPLCIEGSTMGEVGAAYKISLPDMSTLHVGPSAPAPGRILKALVSLSLTKSATGLNDELYDAYSAHIAWGAIAKLCEHADKPYTNPQKSGTMLARFDEAIVDARSKRSRNNSSQPMRVRGHFY
mgnify:CR=1 FL=1